MTASRRHLDTIRRLIARHADSGVIPVAEVRVVLAEIEADTTPRELTEMGERTTLRYSDFGLPIDLPPR